MRSLYQGGLARTVRLCASQGARRRMLAAGIQRGRPHSETDVLLVAIAQGARTTSPLSRRRPPSAAPPRAASRLLPGGAFFICMTLREAAIDYKTASDDRK